VTRSEPDTDQLLAGVRGGDPEARSRLLDRHRRRLRQMIAVRMDRRLAPRLDPSDVVQDVLIEADQRLADYVRRRPLPFYPWLRQLAWNRLTDLYRRHVRAGRRSVTREAMALPDESAWELVCRLFAPGSSPSARAEREETCRRVQEALARLPERDREVLILRHLERLETAEIAEILDLREGAVYTRHLRALQRLGRLLGQAPPEEEP
jgi:RNA polymerase sigma-70 factor (ECF subfamily)